MPLHRLNLHQLHVASFITDHSVPQETLPRDGKIPPPRHRRPGLPDRRRLRSITASADLISRVRHPLHVLLSVDANTYTNTYANTETMYPRLMAGGLRVAGGGGFAYVERGLGEEELH